jgi:hypothetical protein
MVTTSNANCDTFTYFNMLASCYFYSPSSAASIGIFLALKFAFWLKIYRCPENKDLNTKNGHLEPKYTIKIIGDNFLSKFIQHKLLFAKKMQKFPVFSLFFNYPKTHLLIVKYLYKYWSGKIDVDTVAANVCAAM